MPGILVVCCRGEGSKARDGLATRASSTDLTNPNYQVSECYLVKLLFKFIHHYLLTYLILLVLLLLLLLLLLSSSLSPLSLLLLLLLSARYFFLCYNPRISFTLRIRVYYRLLSLYFDITPNYSLYILHDIALLSLFEVHFRTFSHFHFTFSFAK